MSVIKKPDLKIFAQDAKTGEIETFPDVLRGWGITLDRTAGKPPLEWFNAIGKRVDEWLMYLTQRGVAEWDATLSYPKTAIVQWNGVIYVSNKETKGEQPDKSQAAWSTLGVFLGLGNYYNKTESDVKFQPKGNYAPAGNYQPAGDYATNTALNNGLGKKFDKAGGVITASGQAIALRNTDDTQPHSIGFLDSSGNRRGLIGYTNATNDFVLSNTRSGITLKLTACGKALIGDKEIARAGDYGIGANVITSNNWDLINKTGIYTNSSSEQPELPVRAGYLCLIHMQTSINATQVCFRANALLPLTYRRSFDNGSWGEWKVDYNEANTAVDRNGYLKASGTAEHLSDCRVGVPLPWPQATAPAGYLICNGQWFNKTSYPLLAAAYPSGQLPDLRGEFIRGLDAGRNIDNGRVVLSFQRCATEHHKHISGWGEASNANAIFGKTVKNGYVGSASTDRDNYLFYTNDGSEFQGSNPNSTGIMANETRPRNIAFLYIVRAA
ncbi:tail fiber protein [Providencia stuartii]|uniref:tail fiber protein n=1 Tax=Providencia TaxID=586 RepID=UPI000CE66C34|nr:MULTISPECIES: tail fiber protein [Providencia]AVE43822.1 histidine kinase [Providencia stuartii]MBN5557522.1 tail fiber protein [Providencia stuartii]MBQ0457001.1 tail fiber protein [Providencia stuartii]MBQ0694120.1 tail fiber protein [Providencia stuartii]MDN7224095.1 tail fiber protein [Providencia stuartii]